ncbi:MAG: hypothetical protein JXB36_14400 [Gammaproteobacteria bacterium]|nr:hypothetical protein [Gammaproteobacteria bacterium]
MHLQYVKKSTNVRVVLVAAATGVAALALPGCTGLTAPSPAALRDAPCPSAAMRVCESFAFDEKCVCVARAAVGSSLADFGEPHWVGIGP